MAPVPLRAGRGQGQGRVRAVRQTAPPTAAHFATGGASFGSGGRQAWHALLQPRRPRHGPPPALPRRAPSPGGQVPHRFLLKYVSTPVMVQKSPPLRMTPLSASTKRTCTYGAPPRYFCQPTARRRRCAWQQPRPTFGSASLQRASAAQALGPGPAPAAHVGHPAVGHVIHDDAIVALDAVDVLGVGACKGRAHPARRGSGRERGPGPGDERPWVPPHPRHLAPNPLLPLTDPPCTHST